MAAAAFLLACPTIDDLPLYDAGVIDPTARPVLIALAGADLVVLEGSRVQLSGAASRSLTGPATLNWTQVAGSPVLLTNPSGPTPTFVAPLAPDTLVFRLRLATADAEAFDEVRVDVTDTGPGPTPVLELGPDVVALPGTALAFELQVDGPADLTAELVCPDGVHPAAVEGDRVMATAPEALPCAVLVDVASAEGPAPGRAAAAVWPAETRLPTETRVTGPVFADPGVDYPLLPVVPLADGETLSISPAGGTPLALTAGADGNTLTTPRREGRVLLLAERRRGAASGGAHLVSLDVSAGPRNVAPTVSAGPDRLVPPGASFGLSATFDDADSDVGVTLAIDQVFGAEATPDPLNPQIFTAPGQESILLFHVEADDGLVKSQIDTVRVRVGEDVVNLPPVLTLPTEVYVNPGMPFTIDASSAVDPDSGIIDRVTIAQSGLDPVQLLAEPVEMTSLTLTAGEDGDTYHFQVSVFDELGASTSTTVSVFVEVAGPYVDPARGDDLIGNGTPDAPFATIAAALPVAARHRFDALRLAAGQHTPFSGVLPPGTGLDGAYVFVVDNYEKSDAEVSALTLTSLGLETQGGNLADLALVLDSESAPLLIRGAVELTRTNLTETSVHTGPALRVNNTAALDIHDSTVAGAPGGTADGPLVEVLPGATVRLTDSELRGAAGGVRVGLSAEEAFVRLLRSVVRGSAGATESTAAAVMGGQLEVLESTVEGGVASGGVVGIAAEDALVYVDEFSEVVGLTQGHVTDAVAVRAAGSGAPLVLSGTLAAVRSPGEADRATVVVAVDTNLEIRDAVLTAIATDEATGVDSTGAGAVVFETTNITVEAERARAVVASGFESLDADLGAWMVNGVDAAALEVPEEDGAVVLSNLAIVVGGETQTVGVAVPGAATVLLEDVQLETTGDAAATGLVVDKGTMRDCHVEVSAAGAAVGIVVGDGSGTVVVERTRSLVDGPGALAYRINGGALLLSSFGRAAGADAAGLEVAGMVTALHLSVRADEDGVRLLPGGTLEFANSHVEADVGLAGRTDANLTTFNSMSFLAPVAVRDEDGTEASSVTELNALGCVSCQVLAGPSPIDADGHLTVDGASLIDKGTPALTVSYDIDGEPRPNGPLPDIGCDEASP